MTKHRCLSVVFSSKLTAMKSSNVVRYILPLAHNSEEIILKLIFFLEGETIGRRVSKGVGVGGKGIGYPSSGKKKRIIEEVLRYYLYLVCACLFVSR